jgi:hypothetical protein
VRGKASGDVSRHRAGGRRSVESNAVVGVAEGEAAVDGRQFDVALQIAEVAPQPVVAFADELSDVRLVLRDEQVFLHRRQRLVRGLLLVAVEYFRAGRENFDDQNGIHEGVNPVDFSEDRLAADNARVGIAVGRS